MKNEHARGKRGGMIDARNEDELRSEADLSGDGYRAGSATNFGARDRSGFTMLSACEKKFAMYDSGEST